MLRRSIAAYRFARHAKPACRKRAAGERDRTTLSSRTMVPDGGLPTPLPDTRLPQLPL